MTEDPAPTNRGSDGISDRIVRHRAWVFVAMLLITVGAIVGHLHTPTRGRALTRQTNRSTTRKLAGPTNQEVKGSPRQTKRVNIPERLPRRPINEQMIAECVLVVEVEDAFESETLASARDIVAAVRQLEQVDRAFWLGDVPKISLWGLGQKLLPPRNARDEQFEHARQQAADHPLANGQLVSNDGKTLLILIWLDWIHVTSDELCTDAILSTARKAASAHPEVRQQIRLTGRVPLYLGAQQAIDDSHLKFQIIGYTLVLVLAIILFRGLSAVLIVAGAPALGVFWSIGWLRLFDQLDNPLTGVVLPVLISMVGFTDGVHLIVHIRAARAAGQSPKEAAVSAIRKVGLACFLTSLTTAIGFGSLMLASNEYVVDFGRACAIGVILTFLSVITFIPLVSTTWLGRGVQRGHDKDFVRNNLQRLSPVIDGVVKWRRTMAFVGIMATVCLGCYALKLQPNDRLGDSQPIGSEAYQALRHCDQAFSGTEVIQIRVGWHRDHADDVSAVLAAVQDAANLFRQEPLIHNSLAISDFLDRLPGGQTDSGRTAFLSLLPKAVRNTYFDPQRRVAIVTGRVQDLGIATYQPVFRRVEQSVKELHRKHEGFSFLLSGSAVSRSQKMYTIVVDLVTSLGTASIIILVVLTLVYRSIRIGLISVIPNVFPLAVTATYLVLSDKSLEIASVCSFTVCLGIAVDDSIHFLTRYRDERRSGKTGAEAVRATFVAVGTALITTTIVLIAGFGTVLTSDLPGHRTFASMACWTIGAALLGDLIFLPALLTCFDRTEDRTEETSSQT